jgi:hypothetical protein
MFGKNLFLVVFLFIYIRFHILGFHVVHGDTVSGHVLIKEIEMIVLNRFY